jgi:hypothetical protein
LCSTFPDTAKEHVSCWEFHPKETVKSFFQLHPTIAYTITAWSGVTVTVGTGLAFYCNAVDETVSVLSRITKGFQPAITSSHAAGI